MLVCAVLLLCLKDFIWHSGLLVGEETSDCIGLRARVLSWCVALHLGVTCKQCTLIGTFPLGVTGNQYSKIMAFPRHLYHFC